MRTSPWIWLAPALLATCSAPPPPEPPLNVVVIVLDTARPDYLSVYGHPRPTSPFLEEFASAGTRFDRAYSVSGWTLPAHASLFSGLLPDVHGANQRSRKICEAVPLLAERLVRAGYQTAGFSNNPWVSVKTGLARGFERFRRVLPRDAIPGGKPAHATVAAVQQWFEQEREEGRPFFLFVNLIEPHLPYKPPLQAALPFFSSKEEFDAAVLRFFPTGAPSTLQNRHYARQEPLDDREWDLLRRLYEGELRFTDEITRALVSLVDQASAPAKTLVFLISDHGENIGDHGHISHIFNLYESNLAIVCLARGPGFSAGAVRDDLVQIVDLYPTILRAAQLEPEPACAGVDLRGPPSGERTLRAMLDFPYVSLGMFSDDIVASGVLDAYKHDLVSAVGARFKTIRASDGAREDFDLARDPDERAPLAQNDASQADRRAVADALARPPGSPLCTGTGVGPEFDPETHQEMQALGYVGDDEGDEGDEGDE